MKKKAIQKLHEDLNKLAEKYSERLQVYEFGYVGIEYCVKMLMDMAPRHAVALETIKLATEAGIKWHVEERAEQTKKEIK